MSDHEQFANSELGGSIHNIYCELPDGLTLHQIKLGYLAIGSALSVVGEPPVASIPTLYDYPTEGDLEDCRNFYVNFAPSASLEDITQALTIVAGGIRQLKSPK